MATSGGSVFDLLADFGPQAPAGGAVEPPPGFAPLVDAWSPAAPSTERRLAFSPIRSSRSPGSRFLEDGLSEVMRDDIASPPFVGGAGEELSAPVGRPDPHAFDRRAGGSPGAALGGSRLGGVLPPGVLGHDHADAVLATPPHGAGRPFLPDTSGGDRTRRRLDSPGRVPRPCLMTPDHDDFAIDFQATLGARAFQEEVRSAAVLDQVAPPGIAGAVPSSGPSAPPGLAGAGPVASSAQGAPAGGAVSFAPGGGPGIPVSSADPGPQMVAASHFEELRASYHQAVAVWQRAQAELQGSVVEAESSARRSEGVCIHLRAEATEWQTAFRHEEAVCQNVTAANTEAEALVASTRDHAFHASLEAEEQVRKMRQEFTAELEMSAVQFNAEKAKAAMAEQEVAVSRDTAQRAISYANELASRIPAGESQAEAVVARATSEAVAFATEAKTAVASRDEFRAELVQCRSELAQSAHNYLGSAEAQEEIRRNMLEVDRLNKLSEGLRAQLLRAEESRQISEAKVNKMRAEWQQESLAWHGCRTELADAQNRATAEHQTAKRAEAALGSAEELSCSEAGQARHVAAMREELNVAQRKGHSDLEWFRAQMGALEAQVAQGLKREEALQVEVAEAARAPSPPVSAPLAPPGLTPAPGLASYVGAAPIAAPFARPDDAIGSPLGPVRGQWTNVPIAPGVSAGRPVQYA